MLSGGAKGLGLAIVDQLLVDGYVITAFSRRATDEILARAERARDQLLFLTGDVASSESIATVVQQGVARFGIPWGLVNNAAVAQEGVLATLPELEIARMLTTNLEGAIKLARACIRRMLRSDSGGRIINVSSIVGSRGYNGLAVYSATKAGLEGMTRALSRELGRRSITVNSVAPGYMRTEMSMGLNEQQLEQIVRRTPLGRLVEPSDITSVVSFLLSDRAAMITGQTITVDGGISA